MIPTVSEQAKAALYAQLATNWPRLRFAFSQPLDRLQCWVHVAATDGRRTAYGQVSLVRAALAEGDGALVSALFDECARLVPGLLPYAGKLWRLATRTLPAHHAGAWRSG